MSRDDSGRERQFSRDRETIRNWADRHDAVPVREEGTGNEDRVRMVPEDRVEDTQERLEWNRFFDEFREDVVVVYYGEGASDPFEVRGHEDVVTDLDDEEVEERLLEGETVTSTVTETAVVESVVTEELTVESELVDSETIDQEILDVELLERDVIDVEIDEGDVGTAEETFDVDRYLEAVGGPTSSAPGGGATTFEGEDLGYDAVIEVEERWKVTRDVTEKYVVESEITGTEVTEADTLEDYDLDVQGLHRTIAESGIIEEDLSTEDFLTEFEPESELTEDDRITTSFTRHRTVEDEVLDRKQLHGDLTGGEVRDMELIRTDDVVAGEHERDVGTAETTGTTEPTGAADATGPAEDARSTTSEGTGLSSTPGGPVLTDDDVGKTVVDPTGDRIGTVTDVDEATNAMYVDANPGLTERIKSALGWGGADEDDHRLDASHVDRVTDDEVRLDHRKGDEAHERR